MSKETLVKKRVTTTKRPSTKNGKLETVEKRTTKTMRVEATDKKKTTKKEKQVKPTKVKSINDMTRKELSAVITDNQIERGIINKKDRDFHIDSNLKGRHSRPLSKLREVAQAMTESEKQKKKQAKLTKKDSDFIN